LYSLLPYLSKIGIGVPSVCPKPIVFTTTPSFAISFVASKAPASLSSPSDIRIILLERFVSS
jgi:hypothetical protein